METGIVIKPPSSAVPSDYAQQTVISPGVKAAATILPVNKTVAASSAPQAPDNNLFRQAPTVNQVLIDPQARDVIFQVVDVSSRRVIRQLPDEALMRMRAYVRAQEVAKQDPSPSSTDRAV